MKKSIVLLALLIGLSVLAYYLINKSEQKVSYDISDSTFTVSSANDIQKIFLAYKDRPSIELIKKDGQWFYNDSLLANEIVIHNLMTVFTRTKVSYIPPKTALENIYKGIGIYGIKVELYGSNDKILKSYFIGGSNNGESATYFLMKGAKQPYAMHLSGMDGNLRDRFKLRGSQWRDKTIFGVHKEKIQSVEVIFPKQKTISFNLLIEGKEFHVSPYYSTTKRMKGKVNKSNAMSYLLAFKDAKAESRIDNYSKIDSLNNLVPFCKISLKYDNGNTKSIKFVPMQELDNDAFGTVRADRFFALSSDGDLMLTQNRVIKEFFRPYDYFFLR